MDSLKLRDLIMNRGTTLDGERGDSQTLEKAIELATRYRPMLNKLNQSNNNRKNYPSNYNKSESSDEYDEDDEQNETSSTISTRDKRKNGNINALKTKTRNNTRYENYKCYGCSEYGHIAKYCPIKLDKFEVKDSSNDEDESENSKGDNDEGDDYENKLPYENPANKSANGNNGRGLLDGLYSGGHRVEVGHHFMSNLV